MREEFLSIILVLLLPDSFVAGRSFFMKFLFLWVEKRPPRIRLASVEDGRLKGSAPSFSLSSGSNFHILCAWQAIFNNSADPW